MNNYGYTTDKTKLPEDNIWTEGNELTLNDNSVVYGYEGASETIEGGQVFSRGEFNTWLANNTPQLEI